MGKQRSMLVVIVGLAIAAVFTIVQLPTQLGLDLRGGSQLTLQVLTNEQVTQISERELEAVQRVIENRVNGLGVSEAIVQSSGQDQLLIQLPGVSDPAQAQRVLGGTAQLEFRSQRPGTEGQLRAISDIVNQQELEQATILAVGNENITDEQLAELDRVTANLQTSRETLLELFEDTDLTGDKLTDALASPLGTGQSWQVSIYFNNEGGTLFTEMTRNIAGTGRVLGIFLDNRLISAPTVDVQYAATGISGNSATISGSFNAEAARDLEIQLRGGALPVPVEVVENRTVGATLGRDSIQRSLYAGLAGLILVLVFMAVYYRLPGLLADVALVVYALLTWAAYNILGVTMTLPGIAGFILSIGMAVDANVLIFERTREELRAGKTLYRSVESGFYRAFSSILDSNVTTIIACAALFWFGAGLVKGFALTLAVGVAVSLFTAFTCTRNLLFFVISFPQFRKVGYFAPSLATDLPSTSQPSQS
ncbi:protein translocase subunit SecD [Leptolyngbyaceae cyanobacterium CCMR0082]|uniref:Protein translocase subunit SecD n=2 Tax=Adonisia turfae TaxID=2950184 RepID=A0A6M0SCD8_9CYAN|nr:protein translocase subunit SecD [Adonisia turfae]MDV3352837.1 protein translocase subunit SecD [Leptothoe sp. LEGE 181152]NEZ55909.1 protein translocase subunit SecD [Adonisia turfae CCMR0081]NEZ65986.1 protein translocase subunit SecD [Adonisia turfae CCMR0082]